MSLGHKWMRSSIKPLSPRLQFKKICLLTSNMWAKPDAGKTGHSHTIGLQRMRQGNRCLSF